MLTESLYSRVIQNPIVARANRLTILTAGASAAMAVRVLSYAAERRVPLDLDLTLGLTGEDGISTIEHEALLSVESMPPARSGNLTARYVLPPLSNASNVYVWQQDDEVLWAWAGSARFTQPDFSVGGLGVERGNILVDVPAGAALQYIKEIQAYTIRANDPSVSDAIRLYSDTTSATGDDSDTGRTCTLPLVIQRGPNKGQVHSTSGLNWGQRPGREPNQAYIPIPKEVAESGFFPARGVVFRLRTDDGHEFLAKVAQDGNKALETPQSNSLLGQYFRSRLRVPFGDPVELSHLLAFGSRFVQIHRVDAHFGEAEFVMEYSPDAEREGAKMFGM